MLSADADPKEEQNLHVFQRTLISKFTSGCMNSAAETMGTISNGSLCCLEHFRADPKSPIVTAKMLFRAESWHRVHGGTAAPVHCAVYGQKPSIRIVFWWVDFLLIERG